MTSHEVRAGVTDLEGLAREHLALAAASPHGRSAHLFVHDGPLRQTMVAIVAGSGLAEHNAPPAASLQVLTGRIVLWSADAEDEVAAGGVISIPQARHGVRALEDSAFVLTAVTSTPLGGRDWGIGQEH
ncbi:cupin [Occultella kanbiaonis]|uniref:cupin n=1 Tax=Occultella kanbiaonis TaxID=2675754 RepID=UPI0012B7147E|nr:cupin [Occultella kanbiaonis]